MNLREIRSAWNMSQAQMANTIGVSRQTIAMVETGKRKLPTPAKRLVELIHQGETTGLSGQVIIKEGE